jgi:hypothetical protein
MCLSRHCKRNPKGRQFERDPLPFSIQLPSPRRFKFWNLSALWNAITNSPAIRKAFARAACVGPRRRTTFPTHKGELAMQKSRFKFSLYVLAILLFMSVAIANAAPQEANFVGTWNLTVNGDQSGGGRQSGDQGEAQGEGGGHRGVADGAQTITITKDGDAFKVEHKTRRGDVVSNATVSGNSISWSEERKGRDGNSHTTQFKATLNGDSMSGTLAGGQFNRTFTAKRAG